MKPQGYAVTNLTDVSIGVLVIWVGYKKGYTQWTIVSFLQGFSSQKA